MLQKSSVSEPLKSWTAFRHFYIFSQDKKNDEVSLMIPPLTACQHWSEPPVMLSWCKPCNSFARCSRASTSEGFVIWYTTKEELASDSFFPRVNAALILAPVSWASTYPTIPCCRSLQNELFNFRLVPQTSARCVTAPRQPAHTAAWWNVKHARVQAPVTVFLFHCLVLPCPCDNGPCCVLMSQCCLIKSGQ